MKVINTTYQVDFSCFYVIFKSKSVFFLRKYSGTSEECVFDSALCIGDLTPISLVKKGGH